MKIIKILLVFAILTLLTQVGGLIYILSKIIYTMVGWVKLIGYKELVRRISFHLAFYLLFTFIVIPPIASIFGRVPLALLSSNNVGPRTSWTVLLNRHYVRPELREIVYRIGAKIGEKYPGIKINYFDANHPFLKGYPLIPHLSHNDGKKLDFGFIYNEAISDKLSKKTPSAIGYGISEEPKKGEYNRPLECAQNKKYWMYNFMNDVYPQGAKKEYSFNARATKELIYLFASDQFIGKILLEPHLTRRLSLQSHKIRQVQCGSVRHDDHFHIQIK